MGTNKITIFLFIILFIDGFTQGIYVNVEHNVYDFLLRMKAEKIINDYTQEQLPLTRKQIANFLEQIRDKRNELSITDKSFLNYYINEFSDEIFKSIDNYENLFGKKSFDIFSEKEKFLYAYYEFDRFSLFVKSYFSTRYNLNSEKGDNKNGVLAEIGGRVYGSVGQYVGFEIEGKNGLLKGDRSSAFIEDDLKYNFKLNENDSSKFFDRSSGYLSFEHDNIRVKIGSDRLLRGYDENRLIIGNSTPNFNYLNLSLNYLGFNFDYIHGWLNGSKRIFNDSIIGPITELAPKYFVHHRLSFAPNSLLKVGVGEMLIYSRRSIDLAYLIPFNFFKSTEHSNQDRDNSIIYADLEIHPLNKILINSTLLIDDIDFSKLGTGWFGNQIAFNFNLNLFSPFQNLPIGLSVGYSRIEPYVFTHRIPDNNFTNSDFNLCSSLQPNSDELMLGLHYYPLPTFSFKIKTRYQRHGDNYFDGDKFVNVGGDIHYGKRNTDSDKVKFLDGKLEQKISIEINTYYELIKNIKLYSFIRYENTTVENNNHHSILNFSVGFISFI